jgi:hypothetical protein
MVRLTSEEEPPFDFWPYYDELPEEEFCGFDFSDGQVEYVYRDPTGTYEHVLVNSTTDNVLLVLVLNRNSQKVHGHRVLNLNEEYGLNT